MRKWIMLSSGDLTGLMHFSRSACFCFDKGFQNGVEA